MQTMTSMVVTGAQPQYVGAPTMTSMYASPAAQASVYMPAQTYAAPTVVESVAAAPQYLPAQTIAAPVVMETVVAQPSFVAAPTLVETVVAPAIVAPVVLFGMPEPQSLTAGLVSPDKIDAEQKAYEKALAAQLKKQSDAVMEELAIKKKMQAQEAKTRLAEFELQTEETYKMQCLQVDQEAQTLVNGLKEAAITQQTSREEAAAIAVADYKKKAALEEAAAKSWALQKQWHDAEMKMAAEYQKVAKAGASAVVTSANPMVPVGYGI